MYEPLAISFKALSHWANKAACFFTFRHGIPVRLILLMQMRMVHTILPKKVFGLSARLRLVRMKNPNLLSRMLNG